MGELAEIFFVGLILYLAYKFIFGLIVPVSKATSNVRSKIKEMQQMQEEQSRQQQQNNTKQTSKPAGTAGTDGEYIDFEEVK